MRRSLAIIATVAQVLLLFAPLAELRDEDHGIRTIAAGITRPDSPAIAPTPARSQPHNATTCPACIAQSLHAQVAHAAPLPAAAVIENQRFELRSAVVVSTGPPSAHQSRAPPVIS
jgi:hypothetical protein